MSGPEISVAMATYNGERFLQEQLDSLAAQTYLPYELVVGDDGSTDGTLDILERFARTAPFPVRICRNPVNLGFGANFLSTASRCAGDWIAFCDQDDVWLPEKLATCIHTIHRHPQISLFLHELIACNERLRQPISHLAGFWISRIVPPLRGGYRGSLGCSMIFRRSLLDVVASLNEADFLDLFEAIGHDCFVNLLGYCTAVRYQCRRALVLYRRHAKAVTADHLQSRRDKLRILRAAGPEFFRGQRNTDEFVAKWFRDHASSAPAPHREALLTVARFAERRVRVYEHRGELYDAKRFAKRLQIFCSLVMDDAYFAELTVRDHLKDFLRTLASGNANPPRTSSECK